MVEIGKVLQDRYQVLQEYKDGGHGITYLVVDTHLPTKPLRILKKLKSDGEISICQRAQYLQIKENFEREALLLSMIGKGSDGRVPELYQSYDKVDMSFIVQEFVYGQTLAEKLASEGPLSQNKVVEILKKLLSTLIYVHSFNCVHRDINPKNIIIREGDDMPVLIDFGIARDLSKMEERGKSFDNFGTEGYIPFEQTQGTTFHASDIYALGVTMIVMLTGKSATELFDIETFCVRWEPWMPTINTDLARVLNKAVQPIAVNRYQSASEMLEEVMKLTLYPETHGPSFGRVVILPPTKASIPKLGDPFMNSIGMRFAWIEAGKFWMGSNNHDSEIPIHEVVISTGFHLGMYQVTQEQWRIMMPDMPNPSMFRGDNFPVEQVSWLDAMKFLERLNDREGTKQYQLPSEAEWEFACRSGTTGDYASCLDETVWYSGNSDGKTHPVGKKKSNAFGLYDMSGNVWEWCLDCWHDDYKGAPSDGSAWIDGGNLDYQVIRGGSCFNHPDDFRISRRDWNQLDNRNFTIGFRVKMSAETS